MVVDINPDVNEDGELILRIGGDHLANEGVALPMGTLLLLLSCLIRTFGPTGTNIMDVGRFRTVAAPVRFLLISTVCSSQNGSSLIAFTWTSGYQTLTDDRQPAAETAKATATAHRNCFLWAHLRHLPYKHIIHSGDLPNFLPPTLWTCGQSNCT